jgi:putative sporulation protein YyaC
VNKSLPPVGHLHITAVVNVGGFMEYVVLQNTRLHVVMSQAEVIAAALLEAAHKAAWGAKSALP